jgi:YegS/Rv2252/BmrU family lipid kinase
MLNMHDDYGDGMNRGSGKPRNERRTRPAVCDATAPAGSGSEGADMSEQADGMRRQRVWTRIGVWATTKPPSRFAHAPRVSRWLMGLPHLVRWQRPMRRAVTNGKTAWQRVCAMFKLAYYVLPAPLLRPRLLIRAAARPSVAPRARIIANPLSGSLHGDLGVEALEEAAIWMTERGMPTEICLTERPRHAHQLAAEAVRAGMDMVIAAGGDGTVNEVVQALAGHATALGVLPIGTINVWAREMGIPLKMAQARELLVSGARRRVDLGRAGGHYFLLMAGIGFDAEVARRVERGLLKRWGLKLLEYAATAGFLSMTRPPTRIWMRCDGKRRSTEALMVLIGNTRLYGGAFRFAKHAVADDGLLDVVIVGGGSLLARVGVLARALARRGSLGPRVRYARCRTIRLESSVPLPVQVDGEVIGTLPMTFSIVPGALNVIVPADASPELFAREPVHLL